MLSYDLSVIDIVLAIALVIIMLLFLIRPTDKSESLKKGQRKLPDKPKVSRKNPQEELSTTQPSTD